MRAEAALQIKVCNYLRDTFPGVLFHSDASSGALASAGVASMNARIQFSSGMPDLYIFAACKGFHGLFLELKADGVQIYRRDGLLRKNEHVEAQAVMLQALHDRGYCALFAIGYDNAISIINKYLDDPSKAQDKTSLR